MLLALGFNLILIVNQSLMKRPCARS